MDDLSVEQVVKKMNEYKISNQIIDYFRGKLSLALIINQNLQQFFLAFRRGRPMRGQDGLSKISLRGPGPKGCLGIIPAGDRGCLATLFGADFFPPPSLWHGCVFPMVGKDWSNRQFRIPFCSIVGGNLFLIRRKGENCASDWEL